MTIFRNFFVVFADIEDVSNIEDKSSAIVAVLSKLLPKWGYWVIGGGLIVVLDEWDLFESG